MLPESVFNAAGHYAILIAALQLNSNYVAGFTVPTEFGCKNALLSDEWRRTVLEFHNKNRQKLARKQVATKGGALAPYATKMNELIWDCDIENHAWSIACNGGTVHANFMQNKYRFKTSKCTNITQQTEAILKEWWNQVKAVDITNDQKYVTGLDQFGPMAADEAKGFACATKVCTGGETELSCVYDKKLTLAQTPIYTSTANENDICSACNSALNPDCIAALCQQEYTSPQATLENRGCTAHDGLSAGMEVVALNMHNYYRRLVATGWAKDKKSGYAPRAKNMLAMAYDCTTSNIGDDAKTKVTGCPTTTPTATAAHSLNYYRVERFDMTKEELLAEAITNWASQPSVAGVGEGAIFKKDAGFNEYANMAHDTVEKLACAVDICKKSGASAVVCQYNKISPNEDDAIYEVGAPCKCTGGRKCSPLQGLCVL
ncbi:SCP-like protein [Ancylostoma ceylanicum]|uniref:SCP-like protein n=1 Tax=Ancylostoma ceylanicum TaxID=53326 RepID=A0A0D6LGF2_9BILA|nr:SCP-like protein [Ancylostoma ceylanicum]